jgi:hypothetical protein
MWSRVRIRGKLSKVLAAVALVALSLGGRAAAATEVGYQRQYGLGLVVGDPTGLSGKAWVGPTNAIDAGFGGYGYGYRGGCFRDAAGRPVCDRAWGERTTSIHADYLWQSKLVRQAVVQLDWHIGAGARALFVGAPCAGDCWDVGVRAPLGLDLAFTRPSFLEVFLELAPAVYFVPSAFLGFDGGLGARAYF